LEGEIDNRCSDYFKELGRRSLFESSQGDFGSGAIRRRLGPRFDILFGDSILD
jgi:hypothetical protein